MKRTYVIIWSTQSGLQKKKLYNLVTALRYAKFLKNSGISYTLAEVNA